MEYIENKKVKISPDDRGSQSKKCEVHLMTRECKILIIRKLVDINKILSHYTETSTKQKH